MPSGGDSGWEACGPSSQSASVKSAHPAAECQGVGVPGLADEFILLLGCSEGIRPLGEVGSPGLPSWTTFPRAGQVTEAPLKTLASLLNSLVAPLASLQSLCSHRAALPQAGGSTLCGWFWGQEATTSGA